ncbi:hypothetical protein Py04_0492 [Pyrococcus sp. ST04]|nr:hypothetical protein Py04_0492 [Pyrococcus sp. ST04]
MGEASYNAAAPLARLIPIFLNSAAFLYPTIVFPALCSIQKPKFIPVSWNYMKPLAISFVLLGGLKALNLRLTNIWYTVPVLMAFWEFTFCLFFWLVKYR